MSPDNQREKTGTQTYDQAQEVEKKAPTAEDSQGQAEMVDKNRIKAVANELGSKMKNILGRGDEKEILEDKDILFTQKSTRSKLARCVPYLLGLTGAGIGVFADSLNVGLPLTMIGYDIGKNIEKGDSVIQGTINGIRRSIFGILMGTAFQLFLGWGVDAAFLSGNQIPLDKKAFVDGAVFGSSLGNFAGVMIKRGKRKEAREVLGDIDSFDAALKEIAKMSYFDIRKTFKKLKLPKDKKDLTDARGDPKKICSILKAKNDDIVLYNALTALNDILELREEAKVENAGDVAANLKSPEGVKALYDYFVDKDGNVNKEELAKFLKKDEKDEEDKDRLDELKKIINSNFKPSKDLEKSIKDIEGKLRDSGVELDHLNQEKEQLEQEKQGLISSKSQLQGKIEEDTKDRKDLEAKISEIKKQIAEKEKEKEEAELSLSKQKADNETVILFFDSHQHSFQQAKKDIGLGDADVEEDKKVGAEGENADISEEDKERKTKKDARRYVFLQEEMVRLSKLLEQNEQLIAQKTEEFKQKKAEIAKISQALEGFSNKIQASQDKLDQKKSEISEEEYNSQKAKIDAKLQQAKPYIERRRALGEEVKSLKAEIEQALLKKGKAYKKQINAAGQEAGEIVARNPEAKVLGDNYLEKKKILEDKANFDQFALSEEGKINSFAQEIGDLEQQLKKLESTMQGSFGTISAKIEDRDQKIAVLEEKIAMFNGKIESLKKTRELDQKLLKSRKKDKDTEEEQHNEEVRLAKEERDAINKKYKDKAEKRVENLSKDQFVAQADLEEVTSFISKNDELTKETLRKFLDIKVKKKIEEMHKANPEKYRNIIDNIDTASTVLKGIPGLKTIGGLGDTITTIARVVHKILPS